MMSTDRLSERHERKSGIRLRKPTFVIATEGEKTEPDYFAYLDRAYQDINIIVIPASDGHSQPNQVLNTLLSRKEELAEDLDTYQYWIVIDHDRRPRPDLERVRRDAEHNKVAVADSNPCFEVWLIQQFSPLTNIVELSHVRQVRSCRFVTDKHLKQFDSKYRKRNLDSSVYMSKVETAIENAELDEIAASDKDDFEYTGSRVNRLVKVILSGGGAAQAR